MNLNTNSPDYHIFIKDRDSRRIVKIRNMFVKIFRTIKYAFKNSH